MPYAQPATGGCHNLPPAEVIQAKVASLPADHIVRIMYAEHDRILAILSDLEKLSETVYRADHASRYDIDAIGVLASLLIEAEPHHKREEDVLFPELESRGVFGPPQVMRSEHVELREMKRQLLELTKTGHPGADFQKNIRMIAGAIVSNLRLHIRKENEILYPLALVTIGEPEVWKRLNLASKAIGPCHF